jgi:AraC-like DNA-binding protein
MFQFLLNSFHDPEGVLQWIISITIVLLVFIMGYFTNKQPDILEDLEDMNQLLAEPEKRNDNVEELQVQENHYLEEKKAKYERNRLSEAEEKINLNKLLQYVEKQKPYLEAELNLKQLSEGVGIPTHQLSMLLSIYLQLNFYTFINKYRVEEAKKRLAADDSKQNNILTIAFDIGFNSKSTFNTVFKKFEGITPSKYRTMSQDKKQSEKINKLV